jgi:hypothetical protein
MMARNIKRVTEMLFMLRRSPTLRHGMVIHNLSDLKNKGTFIKRIKEEAHPSSIERYVKKFLKDNS